MSGCPEGISETWTCHSKESVVTACEASPAAAHKQDEAPKPVPPRAPTASCPPWKVPWKILRLRVGVKSSSWNKIENNKPGPDASRGANVNTRPQIPDVIMVGLQELGKFRHEMPG